MTAYLLIDDTDTEYLVFASTPNHARRILGRVGNYEDGLEVEGEYNPHEVVPIKTTSEFDDGDYKGVPSEFTPDAALREWEDLLGEGCFAMKGPVTAEHWVRFYWAATRNPEPN